MKVGVIRCARTEDSCPGTLDFKAIRAKKGAFTGVDGEIEIAGFVSCGGCPGEKAVFRARELVRRGADTIAFTSCIRKGPPSGHACPFAEAMREAVANGLPKRIRLLDYTH